MMDVEDTENMNSASFSSSSTEDLNETPDHIRISPILVISDDEASMSGFSVRSMDLDSSLMFNYSNSLEDLPQNSSGRFRRRRQLRLMPSTTSFTNESHDNTIVNETWEDTNEDITSQPTERRINTNSPLGHSTTEPENDDITYDPDDTEDYSTNELDSRLRQATSSQIFDTQHGESLDSEDHLFAPEEPAELGESISASANNDNEESTSLSQHLPTARDRFQYLNYLNPSGILPLTARYSAIRAGNRLLPRSTLRNRFSVASPFRLTSETSSPGSGDSPLNLTQSRRLPSYWMNRSRLLNLRNRTRSTYEHLFLRNRLHTANTSEGCTNNSENVNTTESNEDLPFRFRRRRRYFPSDEEIDSLNVNSSPSSSYRSPLNLQSRSNSIEQRTSTFLRSMLDFHTFASLRSPPPVPSTSNCVRARSVSPTSANPWYPSSVDHDSLDDTSVDVRDHSNDRRTSNARAVIDGFMNENQEAQIERPNTPLPPPISDDESPSTPTPTSTNYDQLGGASTGITSTSNINRVENTASSSAPPRTVDLKEIPQTYEELNYELIQLLECPICFEYSTPPINQCLQGHIICSNCRQRVNSCPTCRNMFQESRNLVMEKVAALLRYPCKNAITGCLETLFLLQKEQHEQSCGFRHYVCFIPMCNWRGYKPELLVHVQEAHENHVIHGSSVNLLIPITGQTKKVWLMSAFNELFYVIFFATLGILKGCVRFIGDSSKSSNYTYTISVTSDEEMLRNMNYTRTTHAYEDTTENIDILDSYDLFTISYPSLSTFRRGTRAPVRVTVEEVPNRPRNSN